MVETSSIQTDMDNTSPWLTATDAYRLGQQTKAAGADRRPFAERVVTQRVVTQHVAMFDRFLRPAPITWQQAVNQFAILFGERFPCSAKAARPLRFCRRNAQAATRFPFGLGFRIEHGE